MDEPPIEVREPEEGLYISYLPRGWPFHNGLNFLFVHFETFGAQDVTEKFDLVLVEGALLSRSEEVVVAKSPKDFANLNAMFLGVVRVYEDVIEINDYRNVQKIGEYVVHESLKRRRCIRKSKRHDEPFERSIASSEGGFPFVAFGNAN